MAGAFQRSIQKSVAFISAHKLKVRISPKRYPVCDQSCRRWYHLSPEMTQKKQLLFGVKSRFEVNPSVGGFLQSKFVSPGDLGRRIEKGEKLGEIIDISLAVAKELRATVSGYLFFSRYGRCRCRYEGLRPRRGSDIKMAVKSMQAILLAPNDNVAAAIDAVEAAAPVAVALNRRARPF